MSLQWHQEKRGLYAEEGGFAIWLRPAKLGEWTWSVEAPHRDYDVRGRAADLEQAKVYSEACMRAAVVMAQRAEVEQMRAHVARLTHCVQNVFPSVVTLPGWSAWRTEAAEAILEAKKGAR